jgi:hypothetical protein
MSPFTRPSVIKPQQSYTFSDYFKLNPPVDELQRPGIEWKSHNVTAACQPACLGLSTSVRVCLPDGLNTHEAV